MNYAHAYSGLSKAGSKFFLSTQKKMEALLLLCFKARHKRTNIVGLYLYEKYRRGKFIERVESRLEDTRGWVGGFNGSY